MATSMQFGPDFMRAKPKRVPSLSLDSPSTSPIVPSQPNSAISPGPQPVENSLTPSLGSFSSGRNGSGLGFNSIGLGSGGGGGIGVGTNTAQRPLTPTFSSVLSNSSEHLDYRGTPMSESSNQFHKLNGHLGKGGNGVGSGGVGKSGNPFEYPREMILALFSKEKVVSKPADLERHEIVTCEEIVGVPLGLVEMTEEEKKLFAGPVNSERRPTITKGESRSGQQPNSRHSETIQDHPTSTRERPTSFRNDSRGLGGTSGVRRGERGDRFANVGIQGGVLGSVPSNSSNMIGGGSMGTIGASKRRKDSASGDGPPFEGDGPSSAEAIEPQVGGSFSGSSRFARPSRMSGIGALAGAVADGPISPSAGSTLWSKGERGARSREPSSNDGTTHALERFRDLQPWDGSGTKTKQPEKNPDSKVRSDSSSNWRTGGSTALEASADASGGGKENGAWQGGRWRRSGSLVTGPGEIPNSVAEAIEENEPEKSVGTTETKANVNSSHSLAPSFSDVAFGSLRSPATRDVFNDPLLSDSPVEAKTTPALLGQANLLSNSSGVERQTEHDTAKGSSLTDNASSLLGSLTLDDDSLAQDPLFGRLSGRSSLIGTQNDQDLASAVPKLPPGIVPPEKRMWQYRDPSGNVQGPFSADRMHEWYRQQFFPDDLLVKRVEDPDFFPLDSLIRYVQNVTKPFLVPFTSINLPPNTSRVNPIAPSFTDDFASPRINSALHPSSRSSLDWSGQSPTGTNLHTAQRGTPDYDPFGMPTPSLAQPQAVRPFGPSLDQILSSSYPSVASPLAQSMMTNGLHGVHRDPWGNAFEAPQERTPLGAPAGPWGSDSRGGTSSIFNDQGASLNRGELGGPRLDQQQAQGPTASPERDLFLRTNGGGQQEPFRMQAHYGQLGPSSYGVPSSAVGTGVAGRSALSESLAPGSPFFETFSPSLGQSGPLPTEWSVDQPRPMGSIPLSPIGQHNWSSLVAPTNDANASRSNTLQENEPLLPKSPESIQVAGPFSNSPQHSFDLSARPPPPEHSISTEAVENAPLSGGIPDDVSSVAPSDSASLPNAVPDSNIDIAPADLKLSPTKPNAWTTPAAPRAEMPQPGSRVDAAVPQIDSRLKDENLSTDAKRPSAPTAPAISRPTGPANKNKVANKSEPAAQKEQPQVQAVAAEEASNATSRSAKPAPWVREESPQPTGLSLREIQALEAKQSEARRATERQAALAAAAAEQAAAAQREKAEREAQLPLSSTWASGSSPSPAPPAAPSATTGPSSTLPPKPSATPVWQSSAAVKGPQKKKTLKEIQDEEETRKRLVAEKAAQAAAAPRGYASSVGPGQPKPPAVGGPWSVVGSGGKAAAPATVAQAPPTQPAGLRAIVGAPTAPRVNSLPSKPVSVAVSSTPAQVLPTRPTVQPKATSSAIAASASIVNSRPDPDAPPLPSPEFLKWCREALKGLTVNIEEFIQMLLSFPLNPDATVTEIISDSVYANSSTLDGRRFASNFIAKRKADAAASSKASSTVLPLAKPVISSAGAGAKGPSAVGGGSLADVVRAPVKQQQELNFKVVGQKKKKGGKN